jgi:hypothetical protein
MIGPDLTAAAPSSHLRADVAQVDAATWSHAGTLDWWVKERQQWLGRVRGADGRRRWIRAVDLRPASGSQP